ncbi:MAG: hypothetical protein JO200_01860 [Comamonas sp.]|nr:hypothetical protein [Comamonas sp.]
MQELARLSSITAAMLDAAAAVAHFACIFWGAPGLRLLGAGERLARLAEAGHWYPPVISAAIGALLSLLAAYALSGAGLLGPLPGLRPTLVLAGAVFLARAAAAPWLRPFFQGNSARFWIVSSAICLALGLLHLAAALGR